MNTSTLISELDKQIGRLREARNLLADETTRARRGRPAAAAVKAATVRPARKKRVLSADARAKMAAAQKRRWAAYRKSK